LNEFCKTCQHANVPADLKDKFNKVVDKTFIECPTNDKVIAGCLIKNLNIDWVKFVQYLREHGAITEDQVSNLKRKGWEIDA
jgi:hypothetical protein